MSLYLRYKFYTRSYCLSYPKLMSAKFIKKYRSSFPKQHPLVNKELGHFEVFAY